MILLGDCLERLKELEENSVDACVTDGPYGLVFMNKKWDYDVPKTEMWREVLRVLKPGALEFGTPKQKSFTARFLVRLRKHRAGIINTQNLSHQGGRRDIRV